MDMITLTRQLGAELQKDERYLKFQIAKQANDEDTELNAAIGEFNMLRVSINNEASKQDRDNKKIEELNQKLRECYAKIMENENMKAFEAAKKELDLLMNNINAILSLCANGEDPETCEPSGGCGSGCSSCSGCG